MTNKKMEGHRDPLKQLRRHVFWPLALVAVGCGSVPGENQTVSTDEQSAQAAVVDDGLDDAADVPETFNKNAAIQAEDEGLVDFAAGSLDDVIKTPFGLVERRCVHQLNADEALEDEDTVSGESGLRALPDLGSCVIRKTGETTDTTDGVTAPVTNGWVMAGWWALPFWAREITSNFTVPHDPAKRKQLLYYFSSFEDAKFAWIVQPVLQYGDNGAFGGHYWTVASWAVGPKGKVYHSKPVRVYVGDSLRGKTLGSSCTKGGSCSWTIDTLDDTRGSDTTLQVNTKLPPMRAAQGAVLEAYNVHHCNEYPDASEETFSNIKVRDGSLTKQRSAWGQQLWTASPSCDFDVSYKQAKTSIVAIHWKN